MDRMREMLGDFSAPTIVSQVEVDVNSLVLQYCKSTTKTHISSNSIPHVTCAHRTLHASMRLRKGLTSVLLVYSCEIVI